MPIFSMVILALFIMLNLIVAFGIPLNTMYVDFWDNQNWMGKIASSLFYSFAWIIKGLLYCLVFILYWLVGLFKTFFVIVFKGLKLLYNKMRKFKL